MFGKRHQKSPKRERQGHAAECHVRCGHLINCNKNTYNRVSSEFRERKRKRDVRILLLLVERRHIAGHIIETDDDERKKHQRQTLLSFPNPFTAHLIIIYDFYYCILLAQQWPSASKHIFLARKQLPIFRTVFISLITTSNQ